MLTLRTHIRIYILYGNLCGVVVQLLYLRWHRSDSEVGTIINYLANLFFRVQMEPKHAHIYHGRYIGSSPGYREFVVTS